MSKSKIQGLEKFVNYPINKQNSYSFSKGSPLLEFRWESQASKLIDPSSLRFNGEFIVRRGGSASSQRPNNQDTNGRGAYTAQINSRVGLNAMIDILRLKNVSANQTIEEVRSYSRLLASLLPAQTSYDAYKTWGQQKYGASANNGTQSLMCNQDIEFSLPLRSGVLMAGSAINLADLGGLSISIMLANDNFVLFNNGGGTGAQTDGATYEIKNVSITGNYLVLDRPQPPQKRVLTYPAYNSMLTILNSGDDQTSLNLNLRSVRTITCNTIPSNYINNYSFDSLETPDLLNKDDATGLYTNKANVLELSFMRGAVKFPSQYTTSERTASSNSAYPVHKNIKFLNSIKSYWALTNSLVSPITQGSTTNPGDLNIPTYDKPITGMGVRYNGLSTAMGGADFGQQLWTLKVVSQLNGRSPNTLFTHILSNQELINNRAGEIMTES